MPYNDEFVSGDQIPLPTILHSDYIHTGPLGYFHHSIIMNTRRKLAFFSASNIDGNTWNPIERKGQFRKDMQIDESLQLGEELYEKISGGGGRRNDFDEGHLTSFQEVLWGHESDQERAGADTFYYTNCVPQHASMNRGAWRSLEQYLIKKAADPFELKIAVITGPVLLPNDPYFIAKVNDEYVQIPCAFWKVIYYRATTGLQAVGFMMSHRNLLLEEGTVTYQKADVLDRGVSTEQDVFMMFPKATTYQVNIDFIENISGIRFYKQGVRLPYQQNDSKEIIYKRIEVPVPRGDEDFLSAPIDYNLENIIT